MGFILLELLVFKNYTKQIMCNVLEATLNFKRGYNYLPIILVGVFVSEIAHTDAIHKFFTKSAPIFLYRNCSWTDRQMDSLCI